MSVPALLLVTSGTGRPNAIGLYEFAGLVLAGMGAALALWCIVTFVFVGRGTPAPFDPPRRLVTEGPYRFVRNPMYIGATSALAGAAAYYHAVPLFLYACGFLTASHLFVVTYEEPALARTFGQQYASYRRQVNRWLPAWRR